MIGCCGEVSRRKLSKESGGFLSLFFMFIDKWEYSIGSLLGGESKNDGDKDTG